MVGIPRSLKLFLGEFQTEGGLLPRDLAELVNNIPEGEIINNNFNAFSC